MTSTLAAQAAPTISGGPAVPFKMAHLVLRCADYRKIVNWYMTLFNARVVFQNDRFAFITFDDAHHRPAFINVPGARLQPMGCAGIDHVAYSFYTISELLNH